jgi:hypothetical protein
VILSIERKALNNTKVLSLVKVKNLSKGIEERKEVEKGTHRLKAAIIYANFWKKSRARKNY